VPALREAISDGGGFARRGEEMSEGSRIKLTMPMPDGGTVGVEYDPNAENAEWLIGEAVSTYWAFDRNRPGGVVVPMSDAQREAVDEQSPDAGPVGEVVEIGADAKRKYGCK
jgi:hypothetical protein